MKATDPKYMICWLAKRYCSEDISRIENYDKMMSDHTQKWVCHHRREISEHKSRQQLIDEELYYSRPACELIFMTASDHMSLHMKGKTVSDATRQKLSDSHKETMNRPDVIKKLSDIKKGTHWFNNGSTEVCAKECPPGFTAGRLTRVPQEKSTVPDATT